MLHPRPDDLVSTARFFVREGEVWVWDEKQRKKKRKYFFLFNDILLICKKEKHNKYWLRIHVTLRSQNVSLEKVDNSSFNGEFRLHCRTRSFICYALSEDEKTHWTKDIEDSIKGTHQEEVADKEKKAAADNLIKKEKGTKDKDVPPPTKPAEKKKKKNPQANQNLSPADSLFSVDLFNSQPTLGQSNNPFLITGNDLMVFTKSGSGLKQDPNGTNPFLSGGGVQTVNPFLNNNTSFGTTAQITAQPFGATTPFGTSTTSQPFGTTSTQPFGTTASVQTFGTAPFGTSTTSQPFGTTSPQAFGTSTSIQPFGTTAQPFGASTMPFGATASTQPFGTTQTFGATTGTYGVTGSVGLGTTGGGAFGTPQVNPFLSSAPQGNPFMASGTL